MLIMAAERRGGECPKAGSLIGANNETKFLLRMWIDDEVHGQLLAMIQSVCRRQKLNQTIAINC